MDFSYPDRDKCMSNKYTNRVRVFLSSGCRKGTMTILIYVYVKAVTEKGTTIICPRDVPAKCLGMIEDLENTR